MNQIGKQIKQLNLTTRKKVFTLLVGNYTSAFKGQGIEFDDLREYVPGDNVKDIDWNSTAKTGKLYVRKYIETRELVILFAIDISSSMNWGTVENYPKKDLALNMITLLSLAAERNNDRIGAMMFDTQVRHTTAFRKGKTHTLKILKEANELFEKSYFQETDFTKSLNYLLDGVKKKTICFVFSDYFDLNDLSAKRLLKAANKKHEIVFINIQDTYQFLDNGSPIHLEDIESGEKQFIDLSDQSVIGDIRNEINNYNKGLKSFFDKSKIGYISINQSSDLLLELIKFFKSRGARQ